MKMVGWCGKQIEGNEGDNGHWSDAGGDDSDEVEIVRQSTASK